MDTDTLLQDHTRIGRSSGEVWDRLKFNVQWLWTVADRLAICRYVGLPDECAEMNQDLAVALSAYPTSTVVGAFEAKAGGWR